MTQPQRQRLTREICEAVAGRISSSVSMTLQLACSETGNLRHFGRIRSSMTEFRQGKLSDEGFEAMEPLLGALAKQAADLEQMGLTNEQTDKRSAMAQFLLKTKFKHDYADTKQLEVTGADGNDLFGSMDPAKVLEIYMRASKDAEGGK